MPPVDETMTMIPPNIIWLKPIVRNDRDEKLSMGLEKKKINLIPIGNSMSTKVEANIGDILTIQVQEVIENEDGSVSFVIPRVIDVDKTKSKPYTIKQTIHIASRYGSVLQKDDEGHYDEEESRLCGKSLFEMEKPGPKEKEEDENVRKSDSTNVSECNFEEVELALIPKKIREIVHRGGKTFPRERIVWVSPEESKTESLKFKEENKIVSLMSEKLPLGLRENLPDRIFVGSDEYVNGWAQKVLSEYDAKRMMIDGAIALHQIETRSIVFKEYVFRKDMRELYGRKVSKEEARNLGLYHEFGHHVDSTFLTDELRVKLQLLYEQAKRGRMTQIGQEEMFMTDYARVHPIEYFAEAFAYYVVKSEQLKEKDEEMYLFLKNEVFYGNEYIT